LRTDETRTAKKAEIVMYEWEDTGEGEPLKIRIDPQKAEGGIPSWRKTNRMVAHFHLTRGALNNAGTLQDYGENAA